MSQPVVTTKPVRNQSLELKTGDPAPQTINTLTDDDFRSASSAYSLMTFAYGPNIPWKGCFSVEPLRDPMKSREVDSFFRRKKNSLGEGTSSVVDDLLFWSQFAQGVKGSDSKNSNEICCETDIRKAAIQRGLATAANFPLACQQARAAVLGSYYAQEETNKGKPNPGEVKECEDLQWDEKRYVGSFIWAGIGTILVETIWTIGETIIRRPWRLAPVRTIPARTIAEAAIRPWPLPVRGLGYVLRQTGYPLRLLGFWFATRLVIPIVGGGLLLMGIDWIYARVKDPKCGVGFIPHIYVFVLDHIVAPPVRLVRQFIGLFKKGQPVPEGGKS
ncbi:MAG: hypothetical protein HYT77_02575 [Deltaproteobacteria bacterium]|nr:hypothetical protein [Deltaproteobacteria bacterium]